MSIFSALASLRLPKISSVTAASNPSLTQGRQGTSRWSQECVLCLAPAQDALCTDCEADLPWLGFACPVCALALPRDEVCGHCARARPLFDDARAAFEYRFPLDRLVQRFKFAGDLAVGRWLASRMARALEGERPDVLVVP